MKLPEKNTSILRLKLAAFWVLKFAPGSVGRHAETAWFWTRRALRGDATQQAFEEHLQRLNASSLCIDLGANIGTVSERLAATGATVHAFEPDPWAFGRLSERLADKPNVVLHAAAAGDRDGRISIHRDPTFGSDPDAKSQGTTFFKSEFWGSGTAESVEVDLVDMRRFIRELHRPVDLIKMDIEGAEVDLLDHLIGTPELDKVSAIFVETHELQIVKLRDDTARLRKRIKTLEANKFYLDWH